MNTRCNGAWGAGSSAGYETETYHYLFSTGIGTWIFDDGEPFRASAHMEVGLNFRLIKTSGHVKWETGFIFENDSHEKLLAEPQVYLRINDEFHAQVLYKKEVHARRNMLDHGHGNILKFELAFDYLRFLP